MRFGPWRYISRVVRSPCKVRVIPPIGIVGIPVWSIGLLWLALSYSVCTF